MRKWFAIPIVLILVLITLFSGCGSNTSTTAAPQTTTSQPTTSASTTTTSAPGTTTSTPTTTASQPVKPAAPTGTINGAVASFGYDTFDPSLVTNWGALLYQFMFRLTQDINFEGDVLKSYDISADGNTWTFHLVPNNKFTNGDPVTAADVKFSIERFAQSKRSPWSPYLRDTYNFVSMKIVDDLTLQYVTAHPESTLLAVFSSVAILNKAEIDKVGEEAYFKKPVASGPWKLVEYASNDHVKFEVNTGYCRPNEVPQFQFYNELNVPELATRISMFKTGQIDYLYLDDYARMKELQNSGYPVQKFGINGTDSFAYQWSWLPEAGPVHNINIRKAMSLALNRQEICDTWYSGYAIPGGRFFMPTGIFGWSAGLAPEQYDPAMAKKLILEAGYPNTFANPVITIFCDAAAQDRILYYMSYWQAVGLQVKLVVQELATYYSYLGFGPPPSDNKGWIWFWKSSSYPNSVYHSANMYTSKGVHKTTNDPTADQLYALITTQKDYATAWQKMEEFQIYCKSLYTNVGVVEFENRFVYSPKTFGAFNGRNWDISIYAVLQGGTHAK